MTPLTDSELDAIENALGLTLPTLYRRLLIEPGYGSVGKHAEIYHPAEVRDLYESFFDDPSQLFAPYFPFGCHNLDQELWIIDAAVQRAATIWHETVPESWPEEEWLSFDEWIERYLAPEIGATQTDSLTPLPTDETPV